MEPHPGDLRRAAGQVPTAYGPVKVAWRRDGRRLTLWVDAPAGASGDVKVPWDASIHVDGRRASVGRAAAASLRLGAGKHVVIVG